ncbi:uncharacterized protein LOC115696668 [Cannabis sativa]|uniref:uncharacterized protein LOC115696668 n=1 Tax=Cannabis sativa TaxID=3483 RepID=UPI0029C9F85E|nr:uncharacterized protein LOC115696668 [Cannabis sativa]
MAKPPILSKPVLGKDLLLYLAVSENAVSAALVWEEEKTQHPVYYVRKRMIGAEMRYPVIEKLVFCLLMASRKLRPYFQAHPIKVLTNHLLQQVLQKPEASGRLLKWAMDLLSQFDIHYIPRTSIKGQALADFIAECNEEEASANVPTPQTPAWKVFLDRASNENGSGAGEALISGLRLAKVVGATRVEVFSDSQLVVNQVSGEYQTPGEKMDAYVAIVRELLHEFTDYKGERIPREKNAHADCLAKLASDGEIEKLGVVPVERLTEPSIKTKNIVAAVEQEPNCMIPIIEYITKGELPQERALSRRIQYQAHRYVMMDNILYRRGLIMAYLMCVSDPEAKQIMLEVHEGFCGDHTGGPSPSKKILRQGYFWPAMKKDLCRYGLPHKIVLDNGKQFHCEEFTNFYKQHGVIKSFYAVARPQINEQAEAVNKILKFALKKKLLACKND